MTTNISNLGRCDVDFAPRSEHGRKVLCRVYHVPLIMNEMKRNPNNVSGIMITAHHDTAEILISAI